MTSTPQPAIGQEERDVLVGLIAAGAAVAVPDLDRLAVLDEGGEALAEAIDVDADGKVETLEEMRCPGSAVDGVAGFPGVAAGEAHAIADEVEAIAPLARQNGGQRPAAQGDGRLRLFDAADPVVTGEVELGTLSGNALKMGDAHADHPFGRGEQAQGEEHGVELVATLQQFARGDVRHQLVTLDQHLVDMNRVQQRQVLRHQPIAVGEFHWRCTRCPDTAVERGVGVPKSRGPGTGGRHTLRIGSVQPAATIVPPLIGPDVLRRPVTKFRS